MNASHYYRIHRLKNRYLKSIQIFILLVTILVLNSCGISSAIVTLPETKMYSIGPDETILLLQPKVTYELIHNEQQMISKGVQTKEISELLLNISAEEVHDVGLHSIQLSEEDMPSMSNLQAVQDLKSSSDRLVCNTLSEADLNMLQNLCGGFTDKLVLITYLRVKVGNEEEWKLTGLPPLVFKLVPRVRTSSSYLRAVIRDCQSGGVLWRNEAFIRELPNLESALFENTARKIFRNLSAMD